MFILNGIAKNVDCVAIRNWDTKENVGVVIPTSTGHWELEVESGQFDVTYYKSTCNPKCIGPFESAEI
jgi:hypothetical protein